MIIKLTKGSSEITFQPLPLDEPKTREPDINRAKSLLGWESKVLLEEGLKNHRLV